MILQLQLQVKLLKKQNNLNKPNRFDKFVAVSLGGGFGGGAIVMKAEDIGTFGDINALDFIGTGLDREQKNQLMKMHLDN